MTPIEGGTPMWLRRVGFFIADVGNWLAGYEWGVDLYWRGVMDGMENPDEARAVLEGSEPI